MGREMQQFEDGSIIFVEGRLIDGNHVTGKFFLSGKIFTDVTLATIYGDEIQIRDMTYGIKVECSNDVSQNQLTTAVKFFHYLHKDTEILKNTPESDLRVKDIQDDPQYDYRKVIYRNALGRKLQMEFLGENVRIEYDPTSITWEQVAEALDEAPYIQ